MPVKREILYPIFLECCQHTNDIFWEGVFEDLAYGKVPYGTYISKNFLSCSYKGKEFSYKIERKDSKILYQDIYTLLTEKLGILSYREKELKKIQFKELERNIKESRQEWTQIRRKNIKDLLYEKYVIDMKHKYNLSIKKCKYLLAFITLSIMFKTLNSKDIVFKDDKIQEITGIDFTEGEVIVKNSFYSSSEVIEEDDFYEEGKTMSENWERYLKILREFKV